MSAPTEAERLWTVFAYLPDSVDLVTLVDLVSARALGFEPTTARVPMLGRDVEDVPFTDGIWRQVRETPDADAFHLTGERPSEEADAPSLNLSVGRTGATVLLGGVEPDPGLVSDLLALPGLIAGSRGDHVDARWQGEQNPKHFELWYDGPWEHLPRTTDDRGRERIDVSGNPGRITGVVGWRMWAAQDDWYGPGARLYVDLDALTTLGVGTLTDLGDDRWHLRLWQDGASLEEIRAAQRTLRAHLDYDAAAARDDEIFDEITTGQPEDPMFVAQEGSFPHGGATRIVQYFSTEKRPTTRSRAAWVEVLEFDADHHEVHSQIVDLTQDPHPDLTQG